MQVYFAQSATSGVHIGKAFLVPIETKRVSSPKPIESADLEVGWSSFTNALEKVQEDIAGRLALITSDKSSSVQKAILDAYMLMINDSVFIKEVRAQYEKTLLSIDWVLDERVNSYAERLKSSGNEYLRERAQDLLDVFSLVADEMQGVKHFDTKSVAPGSVVIAQYLCVNDTIALAKQKVGAFVIRDGGIYSHVMILARTYNIPTLVGIDTLEIASKIKNGDTVIVNCPQQQFIIDAESATIKEYKRLEEAHKTQEAIYQAFSDKDAKTSDGVPFTILANIGSIEEAKSAFKAGADGIGLFRTEFLYMNQALGGSLTGHVFSENAQFEVYKEVLKIAKGKVVTIRTFDAGGDKIIGGVGLKGGEKNPLMGLRAIRLSLSHPKVFRTQVRSMLRASVYGKLQILLPLITSEDQVLQSLAIIESVKEELTRDEIAFDKSVKLGIMIETAAAAIISDRLSKLVDFFSLGTNDLIQYTLGIDRENPNVSALYDEYNTAVLRLIKLTVKNATAAKIGICVCGEMAGQEESLLVLGGLGVRTLSMSAPLMAKAKSALAATTIKKMEALARKKLNPPTKPKKTV